MEIIEQKHIRRRFGRALSTYDTHARAQQTICRKLAGLPTRYGTHAFDRILEIGCGSGGLTRLLQKEYRIEEWVVNDLCENCEPVIRKLFPETPLLFLPGDAEQAAFPGTYSLIASASAFQWMQDLPAFFGKLAALLRPGGMLLFNTFSPGNLEEVRRLTGRGLSYPAPEAIRNWLLPHFGLIHLEEETIRLTFDTPADVLRHLKYTGVTATSAGVRWTKQQQETFCLRYRELFSVPGNRVGLTYRPLYAAALKQPVKQS